MQLMKFDRRAKQVLNPALRIERDGTALRIVDSAPAAITTLPSQWSPSLVRPAQDADHSCAVSAKVEIRAKRFEGGSVSDDRYTASVDAPDSSVASLVAALAAACGAVGDFQRSSTDADGRMILQISVTV
ncbi:MAG: hypothetical protein ACR2OO_02470 [Thermomicrobiales bacterium]